MKLLFVALVCILGVSCMPSSKFTLSNKYTQANNINDLHLLVIGDDYTQEAYGYLHTNLRDTLQAYVDVTSEYHCCINSTTDMSALLASKYPKFQHRDYLLMAIAKKAVIGHGTTSYRELKLLLMDIQNQKKVWEGDITARIHWFISDGNYRQVAKTFTQEIFDELKKNRLIIPQEITPHQPKQTNKNGS